MLESMGYRYPGNRRATHPGPGAHLGRVHLARKTTNAARAASSTVTPPNMTYGHRSPERCGCGRRGWVGMFHAGGAATPFRPGLRGGGLCDVESATVRCLRWRVVVPCSAVIPVGLRGRAVPAGRKVAHLGLPALQALPLCALLHPRRGEHPQTFQAHMSEPNPAAATATPTDRVEGDGCGRCRRPRPSSPRPCCARVEMRSSGGGYPGRRGRLLRLGGVLGYIGTGQAGARQWIAPRR
ncbi:hypothetical protein SAMN04489832_1488 [Micromonospora cremea]|uniref:Uncharacterized protein n=1 Tax=Micromonospora cremea TaxID=709881 RepID=A0A1N5VAA4_9ACTN|nr:hypothetical protein SAMN04489832_1488 [Micromonospora cremea]